MKHASILFRVVKRVLERKKRLYLQWLVEHLREVEQQPPSKPMTTDEALAHIDKVTGRKTVKKTTR